MFSTKSMILLSSACSCSVGIGIIIGKRTSTELKEKSNILLSENPYIFPTALAKSVSLTVPDNTEFRVPQKFKFKDSKTTSGGSSNIIVTDVPETTSKYGFPGYDNLRSYEDFILSYDKRNRTANWVLEHLTPEKVDINKTVDRSKMKYMEDKSFPVCHRATNKDFKGSGYDRGHLAAAANHKHSKSAMSQTYLLSNIAPQVGEGFNRNSWNDLEVYTRTLALKNANTYVCTGPLYMPRAEANGKMYVKYEVIGQNQVAVPTHFFKVILIENENGEKELQSFILPNEPLPKLKLESYMVPLECIEIAAGLTFFEKIERDTIKRINAVSSK